MEALRELSVLADLPLQVILIAAIVVLWRENRRLSDTIIKLTSDSIHVSTDNNARIRRIELETTGDTSPTLPKPPLQTLIE